MARIADIEAEPLSAEQQAVFDRIASGPRGIVEGPLRIWLYSPQLADKSQELGAYCRFGSSLSPRLSELAIITIGAFWRAGFEWDVHAPVAENAGVSPKAIAAIKAGENPDLADDDERTIYAFTRMLMVERSVHADVFNRAQTRFGTRGIVDLVGIIGYYSYVAMTIVAFDIDTPNGDPFAETSTKFPGN